MLSDGARVFRWVERMSRPTAGLCECEDPAEIWLPNDEIPDTLVDALRGFAEDFVPETLAAAEAINGWIDDQDELAPEVACSRAASFARFQVHGTPISAVAQPYRLSLLKRVQGAYAALQPDDKEATDSILEAWL
jgi:hypothetical protein